ncbi:hypothetical protein [Salinispora cortesiana]|uniref:hypothetical protein n=1 Tax=Salinispora cortesiana TaxID=1305843 RepID=UPI0004719025|nr:hypothetical protein [Salinispora cortesiana]
MRSWSINVYAPSTLGAFLNTFSHGHVRQVQDAAHDALIILTAQIPLLASMDTLTFVDMISMLTGW